MGSVVKEVARKWNLTQNENLLSGRIGGIFVNITFVKHIRENPNENKPAYNKSMAVYAFEALFQPKYENVNVEVYVTRKGDINLPELSSFLDSNYENFRTSLPVYVNGHFSITLYQRDAINVKAWYVIDFMNVLTDFLNEQEYFSGCQKCGSNDNLSQVYKAERATEICEFCRLKEAKF